MGKEGEKILKISKLFIVAIDHRQKLARTVGRDYYGRSIRWYANFDFARESP